MSSPHPPASSLPLSSQTDPLKPGLFSDICDIASEGIYAVNPQRQIVYWNAAAEAISGYDARWVLGRRCADRMLRHCDASGRILCDIGCPLQATMLDGQTRIADVFLLHRQGRRVPVRVRGEAIRGEDGEIVGSVEFFHDTTEPLAFRDQLDAAQKAEKLDPLTGLANRQLVEDALLALGEANGLAGVIVFDIDHLKQTNETYGRAVGDRVIREVALTIAARLQPDTMVARWGGEEFVVLAPNVDGQCVGALAERVRAVVSAMLIPHEEMEFAPTISAGATLTRGGESPGAVIERAERLMSTSKQKGRNQITIG